MWSGDRYPVRGCRKIGRLHGEVAVVMSDKHCPINTALTNFRDLTFSCLCGNASFPRRVLINDSSFSTRAAMVSLPRVHVCLML
jgi:hypothetical protein